MKATKVLFIAQEITPYLPESEIANICRYLPQGVQEKGREIRTFMPKYGNINERRNQLHEVIRLSGMNLIIDDTDHPLIIKVASIQAARMQVYFIDNEDYFQRKFTTEDENGNSKLYASVKLIDSWSNPQKLKGINEDMTVLNFPFLDSDGTTLYFSAKGDDSLGGYDIFITRADSEENSFFKPDNIGYPFNSRFNDYMYAIDDYNNLGWFASDRYQPEGKVCVYVFVPNESKITYDYDAVGEDKMISLAKLDNIALTQTDNNTVARAKQRLAKVMYATENKDKKADFTFIVNDNRTYTSLNDFRKAKAKQMFQEMTKKQSDLNALEKELGQLREKYSKSNQATKTSMAPGILDKEKRVNDLRDEIERMSTTIRNIELK